METFIILLGAGAYFVFALFRLEYAVLWLSLFFPLYLVKGEFSGVPFTLTEVLIYVTAFAFFLHWIFRVITPTGRFSGLFRGIRELIAPKESFFHRYKNLLIGVSFFVIAAFLTLLITQSELTLIDGQTFPGMRVALGILKGWIVAPILYLILLLAVLRSSRQALHVLNGYTLSAVILGLWGLYQMLTHNYVTPDGRASGPFESANYLALFITPALLYTVIRLREAFFPHRMEKMKMTEASLIVAAGLVLLCALLVTKSYAAMFAFFISAAFYFGLEYWGCIKKKIRKGLPWKFLIGALLSLLVIVVAVYFIDPTKWQAMFQFAQRNSSSVRIEVYTIAFGLLADNWLLGIGMGQFPAFYQIEAVTILGHVPYEWNMLHPHNLYLALWLNLGLLGFASFLFIVALALQQVWSHCRQFAAEKLVNIGKMRVLAFSLLLVALLHGFFDTPFFKNDLSLLFWMIIALMFAVKEEK